MALQGTCLVNPPATRRSKNGSSNATDSQVETHWIAHCREICGITESTAERREWQQCPPEKLPAIKQAFRHFSMLPSHDDERL
jgi:hypothetical protein